MRYRKLQHAAALAPLVLLDFRGAAAELVRGRGNRKLFRDDVTARFPEEEVAVHLPLALDGHHPSVVQDITGVM